MVNVSEQLRSFTRRTFVSGGSVGVGLYLAGCGSRFTESTPEISLMNPERAIEIRSELRRLEEENGDNIPKEFLESSHKLITELYEVTFGRKAVTSPLVIITPDQLRQPGLAPSGDAGVTAIVRKGNTSSLMIPTTIYVGKPEATDPQIKKAKVAHVLLQHEFVHTQTNAVVLLETHQVGKENFTSAMRRGLKWNGINGDNTKTLGGFFEEVNTQLLADFMNDPTGKDTIYEQMRNSPVYRNSLAPNYTPGVKLMKELYSKLCISLFDVEAHHFNAQPGEILKVIDNIIASRGIVLPQSASSILIDWNPIGSFSEETFAPIQDLVAKVY